jgi:hypothetical protein
MFLLADLFPAVNENSVAALAIVVVVAAGFFAGLLYRVGAAVALSFVTLLATFIGTLNQGWPVWASALAAFGLMATLQLGYVGGVGFVIGIQRISAASRLKSLRAALFKRDTAG